MFTLCAGTCGNFLRLFGVVRKNCIPEPAIPQISGAIKGRSAVAALPPYSRTSSGRGRRGGTESLAPSALPGQVRGLACPPAISITNKTEPNASSSAAAAAARAHKEICKWGRGAPPHHAAPSGATQVFPWARESFSGTPAKCRRIIMCRYRTLLPSFLPTRIPSNANLRGSVRPCVRSRLVGCMPLPVPPSVHAMLRLSRRRPNLRHQRLHAPPPAAPPSDRH